MADFFTSFRDPSTVAFLVFLAVMCGVLWYWNTEEKQKENFLLNRLKTEKDRAKEEAKKSNYRKKIEAKLANLNWPMTYEKLMSTVALIATGLFGGIFFTTGSAVLGLLTSLFSLFFPYIYLDIQKTRKFTLFGKQLETAITQMVAVLNTGQTITQAIDTVKDYPYPLGYEFSQVIKEIKMGASIEEALTNLGKRIPSKDVSLLITGLTVAREVGTDVAVIVLETTGEVIRKREQEKRSVSALIAMGKYTAIVISGLPPLIFAGLYILNKPYLQPMLDNFIGQLLIGVAFVLNIIGYFVARKITNTSDLVDF